MADGQNPWEKKIGLLTSFQCPLGRELGQLPSSPTGHGGTGWAGLDRSATGVRPMGHRPVNIQATHTKVARRMDEDLLPGPGVGRAGAGGGGREHTGAQKFRFLVLH